jgi:hypothetical protein
MQHTGMWDRGYTAQAPAMQNEKVWCVGEEGGWKFHATPVEPASRSGLFFALSESLMLAG